MICHQRLKMKYMWEGKSIKYQLQKALFLDNFIVTIGKNNLSIHYMQFFFFHTLGSYRINVLYVLQKK